MEEQTMPFRELLTGNRFRVRGSDVVYIKLGKNVFAVEQLVGVNMKPMNACDDGINRPVIYLP